MKTIKSILILILVIAAIFGLYKLADFINGEIPEPTIQTDTIFVKTHKTDTIEIAKYDTITKTITQYLKPESVIKIDTVFTFGEISTYVDSIVDSYFVFNYRLDIIGTPLNLSYDMRTFYPVVTNTITHTKEFNSVSVNGSIGNSIQISAGYIPKGKNIQYSVAYDPARKVYLVGCGYVFKF